MSGRHPPPAQELTGPVPAGHLAGTWPWPLAASAIGLTGGLVASAATAEGVASASWAATTALGLGLSAWSMAKAARQRRFGVDLVALLALAGALAVRELLAGALITLMLATGGALESWAARRAERELESLVRRSPRIVHRYDGSGKLVDTAADQVRPGDRLVVLSGEVVPVDGTVRSDVAVLDESALTGEALPVGHEAGSPVLSGTLNAGAPFELLATTDSAGSTYAGIVRMVRSASASSSPFVRTADRFALVFVLAAIGLASVAWILAGDAERAVAVLVVATPCPLILAAPVAIVSGLSRCAQRGVVVKGGQTLEALATADVLLFDKTGTLTKGQPTVVDVVAAPGRTTAYVLFLAASLDQVSPHLLASAIVAAARTRNLDLAMPTSTREVPGSGIEGDVAAVRTRVGKSSWVGATGDEGFVLSARRRAEIDGCVTVFVGEDGDPIGAILLSDPLRADAGRTVRNLRRSGIRRIVMVTGDRGEIARPIGAMLGVDEVHAEQTPADKLAVVESERSKSRGSTVMVGDGINDAPALAAADVGVAIGARGSTASSEAADVVLTVDRLDRLGDARLIARRSRWIAQQSVIIGMALSVGAMGVAASGNLRPAWGALLQEAIDVAVIVNALRALRPAADEIRLGDHGRNVAAHFSAQHRALRPNVSLLRDAAAALGDDNPRALDLVRQAYALLIDEIGPHEQREDSELYPAIAAVIGGTDPTATMSRGHAEIAKLTAQIGIVLERADRGGLDEEDVKDLQRLLYGLYAVLELHFAQEDESYLSLADDDGTPPPQPTLDGTFGPGGT